MNIAERGSYRFHGRSACNSARSLVNRARWTMNAMISSVLLVLAFVTFVVSEKKTWEQDLSSQMKIEVGTDGFDSIRLRCDDDTMSVTVHMEDDFDGVIYTRGNFYDRKSECFLDPEGGTEFTLKLPFDVCQFKKENNTYTTTLVIQHDDLLIFPGDLAFEVSCDLRPQEFIVRQKMSGEASDEGASKDGNELLSDASPSASISLADPDPAGAPLPKHRKSTLTGKEGEIVFTPSDVRPRNKPKTVETRKPEGTIHMEKLEL